MNEFDLILAEVLQKERGDTIAAPRSLTPEQHERIAEILRQRQSGYPLQYIFKKAAFMGLDICVREGVFIPRFETEILVEQALALVRQMDVHGSLRVLDLCCGSGAIAVSIAREFHRCTVTAVDNSADACAATRENARHNDVAGQVECIEADVLALDAGLFSARHGYFDLVVANPPYIPTDEIASLQPEIRHEPRQALDGGSDGFRFYPKIISLAGRLLTKNGFCALEINHDQAGRIAQSAAEIPNVRLLKIVKDYNDFDRVALLEKNG